MRQRVRRMQCTSHVDASKQKPAPNWPGCAIGWHFRLRAQHVPGDEERIGGALAQAAHEIGIPLGAERGVDAHAPAVPYELLLEGAANSVEHLGFEDVERNIFPRSEGLDVPPQFLVVR